MAKKVSASSLLLQALQRVITTPEQIALQEGRSSNRGGLFSGNSADLKAAKATAIDKERPLLDIQKEKGQVLVIGLTDDGIRYYLSAVDFRPPSTDVIREDHRLRLFEQLGRCLSEQLDRLHEATNQFAIMVGQQLDAMTQSAERLKENLDTVHARLAEAQLGQTSTPSAVGESSEGSTSLEKALKAWHNASADNERNAAESTLRALGAGKFSQRGEVVPFDKERHIGTKPVLSGTSVEVLTEGWECGQRVIHKATVKPVSG